MAVYMIAALERLNDQYEDYVTQGRGTLAPYQVTRVAVDDSPVVLEGEMRSKRIIILRFEIDAEFDRWWHSEEYQSVIPLRQKGARTDFIVTVRA